MFFRAQFMTSLQKTLMLASFIMLCTLVAMSSNAQAAGPWKKACADPNKVETCRITQQLFLSQKGKDGKERNAGRILGLTVLYATDPKTQKRAPYMSVQMPLGVDLRPGAVLKVDKGKDIPVRYLRCTQSGCDASIALDSGLLKAMKAGNNLYVGFRPWGSGRTSVLKTSLKGFSAAYSGLK